MKTNDDLIKKMCYERLDILFKRLEDVNKRIEDYKKERVEKVRNLGN